LKFHPMPMRQNPGPLRVWLTAARGVMNRLQTDNERIMNPISHTGPGIRV